MNPGKLFSNRAYVRLWIGQLISMFGDFVAIYAVYSAVTFRMRGSASEVSGIMVAFLAPYAVLGPLAGVFVDRWDIKRTMIASDLVRAALCLLLIWARHPREIYAILFSISAVSTFFMPAQAITVPLIIARENMMTATAVMQQSLQLVRILSPATAAALVAFAGEQACYWADSASYAFSALMIAGIAIVRPAVSTAARTVSGVVGELGEGFRFILTHPSISFVIISLTAGMFATSCFSALLAVFVRDVLQGETRLFGTLGSLVGVGTMLGGFAVMKLQGLSRPRLVSAGLLGMGVSILVMTVFSSVPASVAGAFALGLGVAFILIPSMALLQEATPVELRGRVTSTTTSLFTLSQGIALLISGTLAARLGIVPIFYGSAVILMAVAGVGLVRPAAPRPEQQVAS